MGAEQDFVRIVTQLDFSLTVSLLEESHPPHYAVDTLNMCARLHVRIEESSAALR